MRSSASPSGRLPARRSCGSWWRARPCRCSSARGIRLLWAARLWATACASWVLAFAAVRGDMGSFTPSETVVLAPAALAVAACVGLGISSFENDLTRRVFGWRQVMSVAAVVFVGVGLLPVVGGAVGGRWGMPEQGIEQPLSFLAAPGPAATGRVLWLGDPRALPVGGWSVEPGLAYALTPEDLPGHLPGADARRSGTGRARRQRGPPGHLGRNRAPRPAPWRRRVCATSSWSRGWPRRPSAR